MSVGSEIPSAIDLVAVRHAVDEVLREFVADRVRSAAGPELPPALAAFDEYLAGGKRLRPLLCYCGWYAAGGAATSRSILRVAAALELFHTFALIHDDLIDQADSRRGRPTLHRGLDAYHRARGDVPHPDRVGTGAAILLGDLALVWSDELLYASGMTERQLTSVRGLLDLMRNELMYGQYLDLLGTGVPTADLDAALTIARYKSGKYTVERPLQIGARLAGAEQPLLDMFSAFGVPIGEAFQLRDDVLGLFGDPAVTGKSQLDDIRDGKRTVLLAIALDRADGGQRDRLTRLIGDPAVDGAGAAEVRRVVVDTGALATVEAMIDERLGRGLAVLDDAAIPPSAVRALRSVAHAATVRSA
ncbi:polyprenyl synthetase family protein [Micromonospora echinofusca]|uniref:Polyprenyl synthetase family protein n=2 Tax=Micromonospora echinofusca TaxID=47858 RepID=A0ABS3VNY3_MICEH|nr:polyprenyl synthetase family protein [Micromonospora echinofusca]